MLENITDIWTINKYYKLGVYNTGSQAPKTIVVMEKVQRLEGILGTVFLESIVQLLHER